MALTHPDNVKHYPPNANLLYRLISHQLYLLSACLLTLIQIVNQRAMLSSNTPPACTLQVSSRGIRVCDFDEKQVPKSSPKAVKKNKGKDKDKDKDKSKVFI